MIETSRGIPFAIRASLGFTFVGNCHDSERSTPICPSEDGSRPGECHYCFCAGALPVGPSVLDLLSFDLIAFDFVVFTPALVAGLFASGVCSARCLPMADDDGRAIGNSLHAADLAADFPTRMTSGLICELLDLRMAP
ncbi:hypothetical protein NHH03_16435 [Stieleria sp. TO1_6]|nr:hypothetical protein [Stieleria tagensis]